jgi:hypothetical protein
MVKAKGHIIRSGQKVTLYTVEYRARPSFFNSFSANRSGQDPVAAPIDSLSPVS